MEPKRQVKKATVQETLLALEQVQEANGPYKVRGFTIPYEDKWNWMEDEGYVRCVVKRTGYCDSIGCDCSGPSFEITDKGRALLAEHKVGVGEW